MTRSTVILSLITLLALGGCNNPSSEGSKSPVTGETSEHTTAQANNPSTSSGPKSDAGESVPPSSVSQPVENLSPDPEEDANATGGVNSEEKDPGPTASSSVSTETPKPSTATASGAIASANDSSNSAPPSSVTAQSAQSTVKDTAIVPGQKVGTVTAGTTYDQLEREFGSDRLTNADIHLGEGFIAPSTQVTLSDGYSFNVVWSDASKSTPVEVRDLAAGWNIQGIHNGMTFDALQAALGDFDLMGFGWDYGGTVLLENTSLADYSGKLFIRVQPSAKAAETQSENFQAVLGDSAFPSTDPNFEALDLSVVEVVIRLE